MMFSLLLLLCLGHFLPGADSQGFIVHIGDTVALPCDGPAATDTKEVDVLWMFGGRPVCWSKDGSWCETGHYVNRTQLGSIRQNNFSLVINPVRKQDDGVYMCRINHEDIRSIRLNVKGDGKREDAETRPGDPVCRPYRDREDPPGASSGGNLLVIGVIVGVVVTVAVGAAVLIKRLRNRQRDENLRDPGPSEHPLINGASGPVGDSSAEKMEEPEKIG